jgi:hypothetical protein
MVFLCEHETQGMAYQEPLPQMFQLLHGIMAGGPILYAGLCRKSIPATSVPLFSPDCGERFKMISEFQKSLKTFGRGWKVINLASLFNKKFLLKPADTYCKYYFNI